MNGRALLLACGAILVACALWVPEGVIQLALSLLYAWLLFGRPEGQNAPAWMVRSADYSYSLYIIHFPLLLLALGLAQGFMSDSWARTLLVCAVVTPAALAAAYWFARYFENQRRFMPAPRPVRSPPAWRITSTD